MCYAAFSHMAEFGWNFIFPSEAEQTSWRTFTIVSVASIFIYCLLMTTQDVCIRLRWKEMLPSFLIGFDSHENLWRLFKDPVLTISMAVYLISQFDIVALVFSSLRLLPEGSYRAIQWATSIPHF
jgi:amino acid transporter